MSGKGFISCANPDYVEFCLHELRTTWTSVFDNTCASTHAYTHTEPHTHIYTEPHI